MALRAQQVELTRRTILDAFVELSADPGLSHVSIGDVARHSGVSPATIYRHFPNRDVLVAAAAVQRIDERVEPDAAWTHDHLAEHLRTIWSDMEANIAVARQATVTEAGRELRRARLEPMRSAIQAALVRAGLDPAAPEMQHLLACLALLTSAHAFLDLHDRLDLGAVEAVEAAIWGHRALLAAAGVDPDAFVLTDPNTEER